MSKELFNDAEELLELPGEIVFNIDVMLAKRKMKVGELADRVGITISNISILKNGKAKAIKVSTLIKLCDALNCQPGDLLEYRPFD
ncbi:MAG: helix-turn-helix transcriptional regulator [Clostridia bacterium]|nr:helix-turn-helix transcriptional regulator [Clostridia bacterium]